MLSECFGAGTGCGWCRRYLIALFEAAQESPGKSSNDVEIPHSDQYAIMRKHYRQANNDQLSGDPISNSDHAQGKDDNPEKTGPGIPQV